MPYSIEQMFTLVNDIESYPLFLPWCDRAVVLEKSTNTITAQLTLGKGGFEKSFTTVNTLTPSTEMVMALVDGPFKHLRGHWLFQSVGDGHCQVSLDLTFQFSNRIMAAMFGPVFQQAANRLVDAFVKRADAVYASR